MLKKYRALRLVSALYKFIAILIFLLTIVGAIGAALIGGGPSLAYNPATNTIITVPNQNPIVSAVIAFIGTLLGGAIIAVSLYAFANLIDLLIATEENTRATAVLLNRLGRRLQSVPPARPVVAPPAK